MANSVIVLGAKGRFGRAAVDAFHAEGWAITALARQWKPEDKLHDIQHITGSAFDAAELLSACMGHDVIVNAINPPYEQWEAALPVITKNVIAAGKASGATVMIPGNVYNYGNQLPTILYETTPHVRNTKKGRLRIEMEQDYRAAKGLQTIVLRSGDFIEGRDSGNWFETYIVNKVEKGFVTYPGATNRTHSWSYLPDMARAMVGLANQRDEFASFEEFGFRGYAITGEELVAAIEKAMQRPLKIKSFPWTLVKLMSIFSKQIREVQEMRYLWDRPHEINDTKLSKVLSDFKPTPLHEAMTKATGTGVIEKGTSIRKSELKPAKI